MWSNIKAFVGKYTERRVVLPVVAFLYVYRDPNFNWEKLVLTVVLAGGFMVMNTLEKIKKA